jgi:methylated-DNA-[protein]-cysteine S-methyltransferase
MRSSRVNRSSAKAVRRATRPVDTVLVFPSELGWMAAIVAGRTVRQLTFGHASAKAARAALDPNLLTHARAAKRNTPLERRLREFASGKPDDLRDIPVETGAMSDFQIRIQNECRRIPYGRTLSYAALAARAGVPRGARAVGNCMAGNRVPLVVPCHRVVRSDGGVGSYSAEGGAAMKRRLLELESGI